MASETCRYCRLQVPDLYARLRAPVLSSKLNVDAYLWAMRHLTQFLDSFAL